MVLHNRIIPQAIQNAIYKEIDAVWEGAVENMSILFDKDKILKGTEWIKGSDAPVGSDPFSGLDIPDEKPKPIKTVGETTKTTDIPKTKKLNNLF